MNPNFLKYIFNLVFIPEIYTFVFHGEFKHISIQIYLHCHLFKLTLSLMNVNEVLL